MAETSFQWLEGLLRDEGFLVGHLSHGDEQAIDRILRAIRERIATPNKDNRNAGDNQ